MFTPALIKLKEDLPDAEIDALVMFKGVKDIYSRLPQIDKVIHHDFMNANPFSSLKLVLGLRGKYDYSINVYPSNRKEYNIINMLEGAKNKVGIHYIREGFKNLSFLNNIIIKENDDLHNVEENIKMIEAITKQKSEAIANLQFPLTDDDKSFAEDYLAKIGITENDLVIGYHPGSNTLKNHINRRWSPDNFAELGKMLVKEYNAKILLFGGPEEDSLKQEIVEKIDHPDGIKVITSNLGQSAAVMKRSNLFVSNDSSLMHVASALQLKTVAIIGPTNTNYIKPWQTEHSIASLNLECAPCFFYSPKPLNCAIEEKYKCVRALSPEMVFTKCSELLGSSGE